jgi:hypothetical protein
MTSAALPCPRCGRGAAKIPSHAQVERMAAELPLAPSLLAGSDVQEARLAACASCDALREGVLCAHCGCFTLLRARIKNADCPRPGGNRWNGEPAS